MQRDPRPVAFIIITAVALPRFRGRKIRAYVPYADRPSRVLEVSGRPPCDPLRPTISVLYAPVALYASSDPPVWSSPVKRRSKTSKSEPLRRRSSSLAVKKLCSPLRRHFCFLIYPRHLRVSRNFPKHLHGRVSFVSFICFRFFVSLLLGCLKIHN